MSAPGELGRTPDGAPGDDLDLFGVGDMLDVELSLLGLCADNTDDDGLFSLADLQ